MGFRQRIAAVLIGTVVSAAAPAKTFDYWLLALSWSPQYCARAQHGGQQCDTPHGFVVHGLWPQYERGYPKDCGRAADLPDRLVSQMLPLMPSRSLVEHEWETHGVCSELDAEQYFRRIREAAARVKIPASLLPGARVDARTRPELEALFVKANPKLRADGIAVQCSGADLREVRICLDKDLGFRRCGTDVRDVCGRKMNVRPAT